MKRPEGFDPAAKRPPASTPQSSPTKPPRAEPPRAQPKAEQPEAHETEAHEPKAQQSKAQQPKAQPPMSRPGAAPKRPEQSGAAPKRPVTASSTRVPASPSARPGVTRPTIRPSVPKTAPDAAPRAEKSARLPNPRAELRRAARERKRFERGEIRRFTRRVRSRRTIWLSVAGVVVALGIVLAIAVFSPILALRTITVEGTSRIDKAEVLKAVDGQLGTPLALIDSARLERDLSGFSLIRSYVTETVPPNTIIIHIEEREPVGVVQNGDSFDLVDPAGIAVQSTTERPVDVPLIVVEGGKTDGAAFDSAVEVLLALPPTMLALVDTITASTQDDVRFVMRGVGQSVVWGSADRSAYKARVLTALVAKTTKSVKYEYDVSAPESAVITKR